MSAPQVFAVMLADASIHLPARGTMDAGVRQHDDDLHERVDAYLRAGPVEGKESEYRIIAELRAMSDDVDKMGRTIARCNVIAARTVGKLTTFLKAPASRDFDNAR